MSTNHAQADDSESIRKLRRRTSEILYEVEQDGASKERVATLLEDYAAAVRNGYTCLPEDRGQWWREEHDTATQQQTAQSD